MFNRRKHRYGKLPLLAAVAIVAILATEETIWRRGRAYERDLVARATRVAPAPARHRAGAGAPTPGLIPPEALALRLGLRVVRRFTCGGRLPAWNG